MPAVLAGMQNAEPWRGTTVIGSRTAAWQTQSRPGFRPATRERYAHRAERVWQISPPTLDDRLPVLSAPDHDHHLPRRIPHFLLDLPVDAEQGADTFHWPRQFQLSAVARRLLDGDAAIGDLRAVRRLLQSPHWPYHRPSHQQSSEQGSAQMARHAARSVGHPAGIVVAWLVVAVRSDAFRIQLGPERPRFRRNPVAERPVLGTLFRDPGECVVRRAILPDHVPRRTQIGAGAAL